jgi:hypothetical protein
MTSDFEALLPTSPMPEELAQIPPLPIFCKESIDFANALSGELLRHRDVKAFPDLVALAYWLRRAHVERLRLALLDRVSGTIQHPRGTVFHIAPSNVDTIFVYSWLLSLLTGNRNIVRLPSKQSVQTDMLVQAVARVLSLPAHHEVARRNLLVRYVINDVITTRLSAVCDVRVIWGGNDTIRNVRQIPLPPHAIEVAFANKYSLAAIELDRWLSLSDADRQTLAQAFVNDAYTFDQMACSSPRLVLWVGSLANLSQASSDFWLRVEGILADSSDKLDDVDIVNKWIAQDSLAIQAKVAHRSSVSNRLNRTWLAEPGLHVDLHCGAGLFLESHLHDLPALAPLLSRTVQTLSYACFDLDTLRDFLTTPGLAGIDRVVPFGQALAFSDIWDGHDLLRTFVRQVTLL